MASCKSCRADVRWVVFPLTGSKAPLDTKPSPAGNIRVIGPRGVLRDVHAEVLTKEGVAAARAEGTPLYTSHFATCVDAAKHRRAR